MFPPPSSYRFMQDNDPKHTSRVAKEYFTSKDVNWWRTPPESPDMNPIENLLHELKKYIRCTVKPTNEDELVDGMSQFWESVHADKCCRYIEHLKKVLPKVIEKNGEATGY